MSQAPFLAPPVPAGYTVRNATESQHVYPGQPHSVEEEFPYRTNVGRSDLRNCVAVAETLERVLERDFIEMNYPRSLLDEEWWRRAFDPSCSCPPLTSHLPESLHSIYEWELFMEVPCPSIQVCLFFGRLNGQCPLLEYLVLSPAFRCRMFCSLFAIVLHGTRMKQGSIWNKPLEEPTHLAALASYNSGVGAPTVAHYPSGDVMVSAHGSITPRTPTRNDRAYFAEICKEVTKAGQQVDELKTFVRCAVSGTPVVVFGVSGTNKGKGVEEWNRVLSKASGSSAMVGASTMALPQRLAVFIFDLLDPALKQTIESLMLSYLNETVNDNDKCADGVFYTRPDFGVLDLRSASGQIAAMIDQKCKSIVEFVQKKLPSLSCQALLNILTPGKFHEVGPDLEFLGRYEAEDTKVNNVLRGAQNTMQQWLTKQQLFPEQYVTKLRNKMKVRCGEDSCFALFVDKIIDYAESVGQAVGSLPFSISAHDAKTPETGKDFCESCQVKMSVVSLVPYIMRILGLKSVDVFSLLEGYSDFAAKYTSELQCLVPLAPHGGRRSCASRRVLEQTRKDNPEAEIHIHM